MSNVPAYSAFTARLDAVRQQIIDRCGGDAEARRTGHLLGLVSRRLKKLPRIAILGEVNSGKTSLANALLGSELLHTDVIHNTRATVLLRYAETPEVRLRRGDQTAIPLDARSLKEQARDGSTMIEVGVPFACLKDFEIIDTPGTTSADEQMHRSVAIGRQADAVIWCTLGTQAWKASEVACCRALGQRLPRAGVLAVTHADLLDASDQEKVRRRLEAIAGHQFRAIAMTAMPVSEAHVDSTGAASAGTFEVIAAVHGAVDAVRQLRCEQAKKIVRRFSLRLAASMAAETPDAPYGTPSTEPSLAAPIAERLVAAE